MNERRDVKRAKDEDCFMKVAAEVAPVLGNIIDAYGGVCSYAIIQVDEEWKKACEKHHCTYRAKKIIETFTDYMMPLPDGHHVATAKGYEDGVVLEDGNVDKTKMKANWDMKKNIDAKNGIRTGQNAPAVTPTRPPPTGAQKEAIHAKILAACKKLTDVATNPNASIFDAALRELQAARHELIGKSASRVTTPVKEELVPFITYTRQLMVRKGLRPYQPMKLGEMANDGESKRLREELNSNMKMIKMIELFPEYFVIGFDAINIAMATIALTDEGAKVRMPEDDGRAASRQGGYGGGPSGWGCHGGWV